MCNSNNYSSWSHTPKYWDHFPAQFVIDLFYTTSQSIISLSNKSEWQLIKIRLTGVLFEAPVRTLRLSRLNFHHNTIITNQTTINCVFYYQTKQTTTYLWFMFNSGRLPKLFYRYLLHDDKPDIPSSSIPRCFISGIAFRLHVPAIITSRTFIESLERGWGLPGN